VIPSYVSQILNVSAHPQLFSDLLQCLGIVLDTVYAEVAQPLILFGVLVHCGE
jgi:hypothetical protein